jgi:hypothetical protein
MARSKGCTSTTPSRAVTYRELIKETKCPKKRPGPSVKERLIPQLSRSIVTYLVVRPID